MDLAQAQRAFRKLAELGTPGSVTAALIGVEYAQLATATAAQLKQLQELLRKETENNRVRSREVASFEREEVKKKFAPPTSKPQAPPPITKVPAPVPSAPEPKDKGGRPKKHHWDDAWLCALHDTNASIYAKAKELGVSRQALHQRVRQAVTERNNQAQAARARVQTNVGPDHATELWLIEVWTPKGTVTLIKPFWTRAAADKFMEEQGHYYYKPPRIVRFVPAGD